MTGTELPPSWLRAALDPPRAFGPPSVSGLARATPEDFVVDEDLGFAPEGEGPHWLLRVRKREANTEFVARVLAKHGGQRVLDVGFAGLKDRHAVATQWFSVARGKSTAAHWLSLEHPEFQVLEAHAHRRKLQRGALASNRFQLNVRHLKGDLAALIARAEALRAHGIPNYFGEQRFGHDVNNLVLAATWAATREPPRARSDRGFALSAARSVIFNAVLAARVERGGWATLQPGDVANLEGSRSVFAVTAIDETLEQRIRQFDLHPTGPLWGSGPSLAGGAVLALEQQVAADYAPLTALLAAEGLRPERRSLRIKAEALTAELSGDTLALAFRLPAGAFATAVLRELIGQPRTAP